MRSNRLGEYRVGVAIAAALSLACASPVFAAEGHEDHHDDHGHEGDHGHHDDHGHEGDHGHGHEGDVEFELSGGAIDIEFDMPGMVVFEADFLDGLDPLETDDPGFNNDDKPLEVRMQPGSLLGFNVVQPLTFWDGSDFADPGAASILIDAPLLVADGFFGNVIGEADAGGFVHSHVDFRLNNGALGAYGLVMSLTTDESGIADSRQFGVFFNNGLDDAAFEAGVDAFNAQVVPVPAAVWLFGSAAALLGTRIRRQA